MTVLRGIQPAELSVFWSTAEPLISRALKYGAGYRWTTEAIKADVMATRQQLWLTWPDCALALVTRFDVYAKAKVLVIFGIGGRMPDNWRPILAELQHWAESNGCTEIETGGRPGWARRLAAEGYEAAPWSTLRKEI